VVIPDGRPARRQICRVRTAPAPHDAKKKLACSPTTPTGAEGQPWSSGRYEPADPGPADPGAAGPGPAEPGPQDKAQQGGEGRQSQSTTTGVATPAQGQVLSTIPNNTTTITSYYKKNVYDRSDVKIGQITDVLVDKDGKIDGFMMAIGGFLGIGEKNVAVPFDAVKVSEKNGDWWLTMDSTKDQLDKAPGFKYDDVKATWVPAA
jgi:sporulation protein YlmC with PRC-barrel domain